MTSRLLQYKLWVTVNVLELAASHGDATHELIARLAIIELQPPILARALEPLPVALGTFDTFHVASIKFLRNDSQGVALASCDDRLLDAARRLHIPLAAF